MVIRVECTGCNKYYMAPDEAAGEATSSLEVGEFIGSTCPFCGHGEAKVLTLIYLGKAK